jgi:leucyl aminopeptidase
VITAFFSSHELFNNKTTYKTKHAKQSTDNFIIDQKKYKSFIETAKVLVETETFVKDLISQPANYLSANEYESIIKAKFAPLKSKVKVTVLNTKQLKQKKMGLILAVGQNSNLANTPRIICVEYISNPKKPKLALVGKGIMFDTGGLNIKPGNYMLNMHADMSGSAVVMGSVYAMAKLGIKTNVVGICAIASSEIGPDSYRVNDILTSYDGKTIEVTNTDAEGRLVLADAIAYANKDLKAQTIITIATLTGSIVAALGNTYTGI